MVYIDMIRLMIIPLFFISMTASAYVNCNKHPIYCKIKTLRPTMNPKEAMDLSNIISTQARKYNGNPLLAVAIGMQETGLIKRHRTQKIIQFYQECDESNNECIEAWRVIKGVTDVCMFQFHVDTILSHNINPIKLKNDINYCISWHFRLMNEKKRLCKHLDQPWSCYHSNTEKYRKQYIKDVGRFL